MNPLPYDHQWLTALFLVTAFRAQAQPAQTYNASPSEVVTIHARVLGEARRIYVHRPRPDSAGAGKPVAVLYAMDADSHF